MPHLKQSTPLVTLTFVALIHVISASGNDFGFEYATVWLALWVIAVISFVFLIVMISKCPMSFENGITIKYFKSMFPSWVLLFGLFFMAYTAIRIFIVDTGEPYGAAIIKNGDYVLVNRGVFIRNLTASEFRQFQAHELRDMSLWILLFSYLPSMFFLFGKRPNQPFNTGASGASDPAASGRAG